LNLDPQEGDFNAHITIDRLHLDAFTDFLRTSLPLDSIGGVVNTELFIEGDLEKEIEQLSLALDDQTVLSETAVDSTNMDQYYS
jgi:hypothetical protein